MKQIFTQARLGSVRAQALTREGKLVDDFHFVKGKRSLHMHVMPLLLPQQHRLEIGQVRV